jgi:zinc/manganese transport system permease protein
MMAHAWFIAPALALLLGLLALAPLGAQVLRQKVVFIDLAVAQAAAATALWVGAVVGHESVWLSQGLAALGALLSAAVVAWLARRWPAQREALIGLLYVVGASVALLGARQSPHGRELLTELLAADLLWASWQQVGLLLLCVLLVAGSAKRLERDVVFYPVFALVASLAVPTLGLLLVFAALIAPALWRVGGASWPVALSLGALASALGLWASWALDAPSGACVVLALALVGVAAAWRTARPARD